MPGLVAELPAPSAVRPDAGNLRVLVHRDAPPQLSFRRRSLSLLPTELRDRQRQLDPPFCCPL